MRSDVWKLNCRMAGVPAFFKVSLSTTVRRGFLHRPAALAVPVFF